MVVVQGHVERLRVFDFWQPEMTDGVPDPTEGADNPVMLDLVLEVAPDVTGDGWKIIYINFI